ncbi:MAG: PSD1 and planctomycete cytochrome C domain-containing protein [Planctomycetaceae bacterium]
MNTKPFFLSVALTLVSLPLWGAEPGEQVYLDEVKPLLTAHCVGCHGPDKQQGGLRVDAGSLLLTGGDSGAAVLPGKSAASALWQAVAHTGDVSEMPLDKPQLAKGEVDAIKRWIDAGAKFPADEVVAPVRRITSDHWAFQPVQRPQVPDVKGPLAASVRNPIDAFVLTKLLDVGLSPSAEADRHVLIRRLTLDLTGLLPTPEEVAQFQADQTPDAYERLVDRLLASPHYGERWGRHWLDAARYADSNGFTVDSARSMWPYRDWVVRALNEDVPFDRFTIEQLAGDMLPEATLSQRVATGFHRNTLANEEGGTDDEQFRVEAVVDRVNTTGVVWMGLTVGCAQCHDHKYDPVTQRDFYRMYALFNNTADNNDAAGQAPKVSIPTEEQEKSLKELSSHLATLRASLSDRERMLNNADPTDWQRQIVDAGQPPQWSPISEAEILGSAGSEFRRREDGAIVVTSEPPNHENYDVVIPVPLPKVSGLQLEVLPDKTLKSKGPGLAGNGNFVLTELLLFRESTDGTREPLPIAEGVADHSQKDYPIAAVLDGSRETGWAINGAPDGLNVRRVATFRLKGVAEFADGEKLVVVLKHERPDNLKYQIGCFRISLTSDAITLLPPAELLVEALKVPADKRSPAQKKLIQEHRFQEDAQWSSLKAKVDATTKQLDAVNKSVPTTLVLQELPKPRDAFVHVRGNFLTRGADVEPGVPAVFNPPELGDQRMTRLDFARWLVDPAHPLTARVQVNRIWQRYFGAGLVDTENDFGLQGSRPTHAGLLDWLAAEFVAKEWSMKQLHRLIVTSATYRQSSQVSAEQLAIDPANRWLGRQSRLRLDAEVVRDAGLAASGLLTPTLGGPPVYPPQPEGIYVFTQNRKPWPEEKGPNRYRRGLYTYFWRSSPHPMMPTFDAPDANVTCTRRVRSNTPLQALTLANDRAQFELAQGLAKRVLQEVAGGSDDSRLQYAAMCALSRELSDSERTLMLRYLESQRENFAKTPEQAAKLATTPLRADLPPIEYATWTSLSRVLMNLDEFITRE